MKKKGIKLPERSIPRNLSTLFLLQGKWGLIAHDLAVAVPSEFLLLDGKKGTIVRCEA